MRSLKKVVSLSTFLEVLISRRRALYGKLLRQNNIFQSFKLKIPTWKFSQASKCDQLSYRLNDTAMATSDRR